MSFTLSNLEMLLFIAARITGFIFTAPLFSVKNVPQRAKVLFSVALSIIVYITLKGNYIEYNGIIEYTVILIKEVLCGMTLGLFCHIAYYIITMAGQMIDTEIGFSSAQEFDPSTNIQTTISSTFFGYAVMLMLIVTNMHLYIIKAVIDSFKIVPVGGVSISGNIFNVMLGFIRDYMIIAFRIILPIFAAMLVVNTILAILAKAAPQMNMFVIGFQLKIFIGLMVLMIMMMFLPAISDLIFNKMIEYMKEALYYMGGGT